MTRPFASTRSAVAVATLAAIASLSACSSTKPTGTLALTFGGESDTLTRAPTPTKLVVDAIDPETRGVAPIATVSLPATGTIDLADLNPSAIAILRVTGADATNDAIVRGVSLPIQVGALDGVMLPLFVQRTRELARMPALLPDGREDPKIARVGRYIAVAGGPEAASARTGGLYDLLWHKMIPFPKELPREPRVFTQNSGTILLIDERGASWVDPVSLAYQDIPTTFGGTYAEILDGTAIAADDGSTYIVGATRVTGEPTARVLRVGTDGKLAFASLTKPRLGATATWIPERGLVVAGGSADAAAIEVLGPGATSAVAPAYPPRAVRGASALAFDATNVVLIGGTDANGAPPRSESFALDCATACAPVEWGPALPTVLASSDGFELTVTEALVVGLAPDGTTLVFEAEKGVAPRAVPTRVPRRRAHAVRLPTGAVAVVGGDPSVESYAR